MDGKNSDLQRALRALAEARRQGQGGHPPPEALAAYAGGVLPASEVESLREHLAVCPECTAFLLDYDDFLDSGTPGGEGPEALGAEDLDEQWRRLRQGLGVAGTPTPFAPIESSAEPSREPLRAPTTPPGRTSPALRFLRWFQVLAATFLLTTLLALGWGWRLHRHQGPQINVPMAALLADSERTRGVSDDGDRALELVPGAREIFLSLLLRGGSPSDSYEIRLLRDDGNELWRATGLRPSPLYDLRIALPRSLIPAGSYTLELRADGADAEVPLEVFSFRTVH